MNIDEIHAERDLYAELSILHPARSYFLGELLRIDRLLFYYYDRRLKAGDAGYHLFDPIIQILRARYSETLELAELATRGVGHVAT